MRLAAATLVLACGCDRLLGITPLDATIDSPYSQDPPYVSAVLTDSPVGYFRLDETTGVDAADLTGGPSGTYLGNVMLGQPGAFPDSGNSVAFDGNNSAVSLANRFDFTGTMSFSLEAWIQPGFTGTYHEIGSRWHEPMPPIVPVGYTWWQDDSELGFERDSAQGTIAYYDGLVENQWVYVVATFDGTTMTLYVGGREVMATPSPIATPEVSLTTLIGGANGEPSGVPFLGRIDEYAIYDHALTPERVSAHFAAATP